MATTSWNISDQYFETCSCDFVCPCILGQMAVLLMVAAVWMLVR